MQILQGLPRHDVATRAFTPGRLPSAGAWDARRSADGRRSPPRAVTRRTAGPPEPAAARLRRPPTLRYRRDSWSIRGGRCAGPTRKVVRGLVPDRHGGCPPDAGEDGQGPRGVLDDILIAWTLPPDRQLGLALRGSRRREGLSQQRDAGRLEGAGITQLHLGTGPRPPLLAGAARGARRAMPCMPTGAGFGGCVAVGCCGVEGSCWRCHSVRMSPLFHPLFKTRPPWNAGDVPGTRP